MTPAVSFKKPPRSFEARKSRRNSVTSTGKVVCRNGVAVYNCTIRDISETGARIGISEAHIVPARFYLVDPRKRTVHEAQVIWVAYSQRGLRFTQSYMLDQRLPPEMEFMKRLSGV